MMFFPQKIVLDLHMILKLKKPFKYSNIKIQQNPLAW